MDCDMCATSIITRRRGAWWLDGREAIQRREGHLRPSASGGPTGSAAARLSGGRLAPQGRFIPRGRVQWGDVSTMGSGEAAEKLSLEEDSCTSTKEDCRVRHIAKCHHAARGGPTLQDPGLMGLWAGPWRWDWRLEEEDSGGGAGPRPPPRRRRRLRAGVGYRQTCARGGRRRRRRRWGWRPSPCGMGRLGRWLAG